MNQLSASMADRVDRPPTALPTAIAEKEIGVAASAGDVVRIEGVTKTFRHQVVLDNMNLTIGQGEFLTLLGPSGCGKSTTLNAIAGFLTPDSGKIFLRGRLANGLAPRHRRLGMVFQSWALFPHMTVFDNVAYGLRARGTKSGTIRARVSEMLDLVRLSAAAAKYPSQLSGGMQQRVALARALVTEPDVLLLDEPLSNLDAGLRKEMQIEIKRIHDQLRVTTVLVTHSQEEALVMSDTVAVMRGGRIEQIAPPVEIYRHPRTSFVCTFLGDANILAARVERVAGEHVQISAGGLRMLAACGEGRPAPARGTTVRVALRPEWIALCEGGSDDPSATGTQANVLTGEVISTVFLGDRLSYRVQVGTQVLSVVCVPNPNTPIHARGDVVTLHFAPASLQILEDSPNDDG